MPLRASNKGEYSDSIIVSFESRWRGPLRANTVSIVFRKRGPSQLSLKEIFVYVGSPMSAIIGTLPVLKHEVVSKREALRLASSGAISKEDLARYSLNYDRLHLFWVEPMQELACHWTLPQLKAAFGFYPPQSFLILSKQGKAMLKCGHQDSAKASLDLGGGE